MLNLQFIKNLNLEYTKLKCFYDQITLDYKVIKKRKDIIYLKYFKYILF